MCGRLVITRWNWEIDSVESWAAYVASALRSWTMERLEKPRRASGLSACTASASAAEAMAQGQEDVRIAFDDRTNQGMLR
jgi:hypothetical protein